MATHTHSCLHFVGFRKDTERFERAARFFGRPDFVHYKWDVRAQQEIAPGDVAVFAVGTERDAPEHPSYDDSEAVNRGSHLPYPATETRATEALIGGSEFFLTATDIRKLKRYPAWFVGYR